MVRNEEQNSILVYWFGELEGLDAPQDNYIKKWWVKDDSLDREIENRFGSLVRTALNDELLDWESSIKGKLTLILLLDQFTRNIFRDTPEAFSGDPKALSLALSGTGDCSYKALHPIEQSFFLMPLMHSEELRIQHLSIKYFSELEKSYEKPKELHQLLANSRDYALKHFEIIERFGRYPHRNNTLGRVSSEEEIEFLSKPGSSF